MHDLDVQLGDLNTLASDLELELGKRRSLPSLTDAVQGLQRTLEASEPSILTTVHALAELDCLLSLAMAAREYDWRKPTMTDGVECLCVL